MADFKLVPQGTKILVLPLETENKVSDGGLEIVNTELGEAKVVAVSKELGDVYKVGDTILYPKTTGVSQFYNHKPHLWIDGKGAPQGDVWAIVK